MRSFVKNKHSRNGESTPPMKVKQALVANFNVSKTSLNAIRENKILAKIYEFTVGYVH